MINIGTKIKTLRTRQHITQEQLAVFLGVTPQAVSRWEAGNGYPDIETLPMIADYFSVTTDELLCLDREERTARLAEIYKELDRIKEEAASSKNTLQYAREAVAEFPSELKLQINLANEICKNYMWEPSPDTAKLNEARRIYETVIENCTDMDMRNQVLEYLCSLYSNGFKDSKRALLTAERLSSMKYTRESVMAACAFPLEDKQGILYQQEYIHRLADALCSEMCRCVIGPNVQNGKETWSKKLALLDDIISIYHIVFGDDLNYLHGNVAMLHRVKATYLVAMEEYDKTMDELEAMCEHSLKCSASKAGDPFTSFFTDRLVQPDVSDDFDYYTVHNDAYYTLEKMAQGRYDPLRGMKRFQDILLRLKKCSEAKN